MQSHQTPLTNSISSVQLLSSVFANPWTAACQASLSITNAQNLLKLMSIESVMPSNHLILCRPLLLLPSIFPSIRVFSNESDLCIRWPKDWSFSFSLGPSNEHSGLISFKIDWFDLLAVQGIVKSLLQHHNSKASILWHSVFFTVQLSHLQSFPRTLIFLDEKKNSCLPGQLIQFISKSQLQGLLRFSFVCLFYLSLISSNFYCCFSSTCFKLME